MSININGNIIVNAAAYQVMVRASAEVSGGVDCFQVGLWGHMGVVHRAQALTHDRKQRESKH
jgi:hypothetical protein